MKINKLLVYGSLFLGMSYSLCAETISEKLERYTKIAKAKPTYHYVQKTQEDLDKITSQLDTPLKINDYMNHHFHYRSDKEINGIGGDGHHGDDYMQSALETFSKQTGDCEDYANFVKYALDMHGIESRVFAFWDDPKKEGHAVCVYIDKNTGKFGVLESGNYIKADKRYNDLYEIAEAVKRKWTSIQIDKEDSINTLGNFTVNMSINKDKKGRKHRRYYNTSESFPLSPDNELNKKLEKELDESSLTEEDF